MVKIGKRSIFDFIDAIKAEQNIVATKIANCKAGIEPDKSKEEAIAREQNIRNVMADFVKEMSDYEDDLEVLTDDEDEESDAENDAHVANSQNWVDARRTSITKHPALVLINAIAHHTRF